MLARKLNRIGIKHKLLDFDEIIFSLVILSTTICDKLKPMDRQKKRLLIQ